MNTTPILLTLILVALPARAGAETAPSTGATQAMTLAQALAYARDHQPALAAARARLLAARADEAIPRAQWYPRFGLGAEALAATANNSTTNVLGLRDVDLPRIGATRVGTFELAPYPSTLAAVGARQEVFDFGRIAAQEAVARAAVQAEQGRADTAALEVDLAVEDAFFAVQAAHAIETSAGSAWQRAKANYDTAEAGVRAGLRKPIELTRAAADLARLDVERVKARAALESAQGVFAAVVGVPDRTLDASGDPPAREPPASASAALDYALAHAPELQALSAAVEQQQAQTRAIGANLRPDVQASASLSLREGGAAPTSGPTRSGLVPQTPNWDAGLLFSWPLYDQTVLAQASASRQREEARRAELVEEKERLRAGVEQAWVALVSAREALPALSKAVVASRANYEQADARSRAGLGTSVELADAQALLTESEVQLAVGRFNEQRAQAHLGRIMGERP